MSTKQSEMTIAVDFDATLANYESWEANGKTPGEPRSDVVEGLQRLKDAGWTIGIHSTRNTEVISEWVITHNLSTLIDFVNNNPDQPKNCSHKPLSFIYIDDRASRYNGENMSEIVDSIIDGSMQPWYRS